MIKSLILMMIFFSPSAFATSVCQNIFLDGIQLDSSKFAPEKQDSVELIQPMISKILKMSSHTLNESIGPKYTTEKGQITLGHSILDGWTLEFNYNRDARTSDPTYRLSDIQLIQPNGESSKLTKSPTTAEGDKFSKEHFSLADLADVRAKIPFGDNVVNVEVPVIIRGALAKSIDKWVPHIEFINRDKLRLSQEADLSKIKTAAVLKANVRYTQGIIKKQSFKYILLGLVMYIYIQKDQVSELLFTSDPWADLVKDSSFSGLSFQEQKHVASTLQDTMSFGLTEELVSYNKNKKSYSMKSYNDVSEVLTKSNDLKQIEKKSGGATLTYVFKNGVLVESNPQKILSAISSTSDDSFVTVFVYPATKRLLLVTNTMMQEKEQESFLTLAIDGVEDRELYMQLKNTLTSLKK